MEPLRAFVQQVREPVPLPEQMREQVQLLGAQQEPGLKRQVLELTQQQGQAQGLQLGPWTEALQVSGRELPLALGQQRLVLALGQVPH